MLGAVRLLFLLAFVILAIVEGSYIPLLIIGVFLLAAVGTSLYMRK